MERTEKVAEQAGIQAIVQIHGYMYPHNATTAYNAICGLDPRYIGIKLDPGNNFAQEGFEVYSYQIPLLGEYIAALGEKDAYMKLSDDRSGGSKGWSRPFAPAFFGASDYESVFAELKTIGFSGPGILMPFYHEDNYEELEKDFRREILYLKEREQAAGL